MKDILVMDVAIDFDSNCVFLLQCMIQSALDARFILFFLFSYPFRRDLNDQEIT